MCVVTGSIPVCVCVCCCCRFCSSVCVLLQGLSVTLRAPVSESLSQLKRDQLQKFAQYLISELPQQVSSLGGTFSAMAGFQESDSLKRQ